MKESVLMMMKMKSVMQKGSKGYRVHCPQCGQFLMVLSKGEAVIHCPQCGITIYELAEIPGIENMKSRKAGRAGR